MILSVVTVECMLDVINAYIFSSSEYFVVWVIELIPEEILVWELQSFIIDI